MQRQLAFVALLEAACTAAALADSSEVSIDSDDVMHAVPTGTSATAPEDGLQQAQHPAHTQVKLAFLQ